jgi:hypothetical protein
MATDPPHATNGSGAHQPPGPPSVGERVAMELSALVQEMAEHRGRVIGQERKITGLINVLRAGALGPDGVRHPVPFASEHAEAIGDVVEGVGDHEHELGSKMYARADRIRAAGRKGG